MSFDDFYKLVVAVASVDLPPAGRILVVVTAYLLGVATQHQAKAFGRKLRGRVKRP